MDGFIWAEGYTTPLSLRETQKAIKYVKDTFQKELAAQLHLERISAPLFVRKNSGLNDDLNGVERKVEFDIKACGEMAEVVQSLAKWKRMALYRYGFAAGEGLYTDMCAIRRDDDMDNVHSIYVDQWDWERVIRREDRNREFLEEIVRRIVAALCSAKEKVQERYPELRRPVTPEVFFITSQELLERYPHLSAKERECAIVKEKKTVFIEQIGGALSDGQPHDGRAPDYDDWSLNGDLLVWNEILEQPLELSSMGVRVDAETLKRQLEIRSATERERFPYHQGILTDRLPLTIGGGIGQSRLCLYLLEKLHVGEVQASIWSDEILQAAADHGVNLL